MRKIIYISLLLAGAGHAQDLVRVHPINDREQAQYVLTAPVHKWSGGIVRWFYNPASQPSNLTTTAAVDAIKSATARWSSMCRLLFIYSGTTTASPYMGAVSSAVDSKSVFGWGVPANPDLLYDYNLWFSSTTSAYLDADIVLNTRFNWSVESLDASMMTAIGYSIGLRTSDVSSAAMASANAPTRSLFYDRTLRGDDAEGCAALYGATSTADSNRAFNWAEAAYPQILTPSPSGSGDYNGYYYRYYSGTNSYVGTKDGSVFFMGPDGVIQNLGTLESYKSQVRNAGF